MQHSGLTVFFMGMTETEDFKADEQSVNSLYGRSLTVVIKRVASPFLNPLNMDMIVNVNWVP